MIAEIYLNEKFFICMENILTKVNTNYYLFTNNNQ